MARDSGTDRIMDVLADRRRRRILKELLEKNPLDVTADLGTTGRRSPSATDVALVHVHLPKLADAGYVSWDRESDTLAKGPNWAEVEPVVRLFVGIEDQLPSDAF